MAAARYRSSLTLPMRSKAGFNRGKTPEEDRIAIIEVGGTAGDIESQPFLEAIRQFQHDVGKENAVLIPRDPGTLSESFRRTEDPSLLRPV